MYTNDKEFLELSSSRQTEVKSVFETFKFLKKEGRKLTGKEVVNRLREPVDFADWEKEWYEKTGYINNGDGAVR